MITVSLHRSKFRKKDRGSYLQWNHQQIIWSVHLTPATMIARDFYGHKSPAARARELFKPFADSGSLLVSIEKTIFLILDWGSLWVTSSAGCFAFFWPTLTRPERQPNQSFLWLNVFGV